MQASWKVVLFCASFYCPDNSVLYYLCLPPTLPLTHISTPQGEVSRKHSFPFCTDLWVQQSTWHIPFRSEITGKGLCLACFLFTVPRLFSQMGLSGTFCRSSKDNHPRTPKWPPCRTAPLLFPMPCTCVPCAFSSEPLLGPQLQPSLALPPVVSALVSMELDIQPISP